MKLDERAYRSEDIKTSSQRGFSTNPEMIGKIQELLVISAKEHPEASLEELIYFITKAVMKNPTIRPSNTGIAPVIFVYYTEMYCLQYSKEKDPVYLNYAALSLFSLFKVNYNDATLRQLLLIASDVLHDVIVEQVSHQKEVDMKDLIVKLTTVAVVKESVRKYSSTRYRKNNRDYVTWIGNFFKECIDNPTLSFLTEEHSSKSVVDQITKRSKIITV